MGRQKNAKTLEISEGLYIKPIASNGIYHYQFTYEGQAFRKSTKTSDRHEAAKVAIAAYDHVKHKKHKGLEIKVMAFKKAAKLYLESFQNEQRQQYHADTIKRHIIPYFSKFDDISKIKMTDLDGYKKFRLDKNPDVKPQTLNRENGVLNQLLRFCSERDWVAPGLKFKHFSEHQSRRRRAHFTLEEYNQLLKTAKARKNEFSPTKLNGQSKGLYVNKFYQRSLLYDIIMILSNTGMRVDEIKAVRWRDVIWDSNKIKLSGVGKVKSQRMLAVREGGMTALKRIQARRIAYLKKENLLLDTNESIQCLPNGKEVKSFKKGFNELLKASGFEYPHPNDKHTMTSLRHFFATIRMTTKKGKRATVQGLAKQMGTSAKMIEKHYGHDTAADYEDEITG